MDALTKYDTRQAVGALTAADYKKFLRGNWGPAASKIEEYYPLSLFEKATGSTAEGILVAIAIVLTDSHYKCPTYQIAETAAKKNMPSWVYEFTHNSTCVWLDTMPQEDIAVFGAAHTAELPYVFGNLYFDFPNNNNTCNATMAEWDLSKEMIGLWTAMAETAKPSTDDIDWPRFKITPNGTDIPTMIFGNSSTPDKIDFSVCKLWEEVFSIVNANNNVTATGTPSTGSGSGSSSGSGSTTPTASLMNDAVTISSGIGGSVVLSVLLTAAATFGFAGLAI